MSKRKIYTFEDDLKYRLKNPAFRKAWKESESVISRIEGMSANPSINLLKKIAAVFDSKLKISFT